MTGSQGAAAPDTSVIGDRTRPRGFAGLAAMASRDITPPVGIRNRNWGPATTDIASGVHRPFYLTAWAVSEADGADPVVIIGADGTWWRRVADYEQMRRALIEGLGLAESRILFCLSHTHAGAALGGSEENLPGGALVPGYLAQLQAAAVEAGREALTALRPATVDWAVGRCDVAADREAQIDGRAIVGYNPTRTADDTVLVGRVCAVDGEVLGTIVNYACHPTTLAWQSSLLSPDYVGQLRQVVEESTGAPCLFLQGASGDLAPRQQYVGDTAVADRHGSAIGHAALAALAGMPPSGAALELGEIVESGAPLGMWRPVPADLPGGLTARRTEVELDLRPLPTLAELEQQWAGIDPRSREERLLRARNLRDGYIDGPTVSHPLWTIRLGDAVIVAHPGEAYSEFQVRLRERFPELAVVAVNLANGPGFVYLPGDDAYRRDAYQAWQTVLAPGGLARLTEAAIEQIAATAP